MTRIVATLTATVLLLTAAGPGAGGRPGAGRPRRPPSATPLAWTHGQLIRLAWSIDAGEPIERPSIVACLYTREACG